MVSQVANVKSLSPALRGTEGHPRRQSSEAEFFPGLRPALFELELGPLDIEPWPEKMLAKMILSDNGDISSSRLGRELQVWLERTHSISTT